MRQIGDFFLILCVKLAEAFLDIIGTFATSRPLIL
jgi:hypothetical protein